MPFVLLAASLVIMPLKISLKNRFLPFLYMISAVLVFPLITVFLSQYLLTAPVSGLGVRKILLGAVPCFVLELFFISITANIRFPVIISSALWLLLATTDEYVFLFRGTEFMYSDFYAVQTAANVLGSYEFTVPERVLTAWLSMLLFYSLLQSVNFEDNISYVTKRAVSAGFAVMAAGTLWFCTSNIHVERWSKEGTYINGYFLNFVTDLKNIYVAPPEDYSPQAIEELASRYESADPSATKEDYPDVVVIMSEAFTDFSVYGDNFSPKEDVLSFYHSLNENTVKGYALSSVFGGKTANSEYEFLTGNSTAFLPEGSIPFMQYINDDIWTIADYFSSLGYETVGMHPYLSNGWNRKNVYPLLGFDRTLFLEDFPQKDLIRNYVSDAELYDVISDELNDSADDSPEFIFAVSMQNHGGYTKDNSAFYLDKTSDIYGEDDPEVNEYLTLLRYSDEALSAFIDRLSNSERKTVVLIFGDHQPNIKSSFYNDLLSEYDGSLDSKQMKYKVPFCIWANYEIEEKMVSLTSLNYLGTYLCEAAGVEEPAYFKFLSDVRNIIPAVNINGCFSDSSSACLALSDVENKDEEEALAEYNLMVYESLFTKDRNNLFFPQRN